MRRQLLQGGLYGLAAAGLTLALWFGGILIPLENLTWKWRVAWLADDTPQTPIVLIALDQASLDWGLRENGLTWPWPREAYGVILDFCRRAGARAVALDLLFSEPSSYGVADDQALAAALGRIPSVGSITLSRHGRGQNGPPDPQLPRLPLRAPSSFPQRYTSGSLPVSELEKSFSLLGNVSTIPDGDGIYRRLALLTRVGEAAVPSLSLALLLAADPDLPVNLTAGEMRVGTHRIDLDADGAAILRYRGTAGTFPTYSAAAVIQSELRLREGGIPGVDPGSLQGAYVIFGLTAPGLFDLRATPLDGVSPGMEIHATALDNLLTGAFLRDVPEIMTVLLTMGGALCAGALLRVVSRIRPVLLIGAIALPLPLFSGVAAYRWGWWLPVTPPTVALAATFVTLLLVNYATEGRQRRFIKQAFNQYLHPTVIEQLLEHPDRLRLGGERREITIFFSDLQGFSGLAEQLDPEALTSLLNDYLTAMTDIILDNGGTVDKYVGDAILAFWNAPLDQPDHAARAVRAAELCQGRLAELSPQLRSRAGHELRMRIGINTGVAVVGNMGSQRRFDYTVLGDAVNLASRLEGVNKEFDTFTLVAEATRNQLDGTFVMREIALIRVVGRSEPTRIFQPLVPSGFDAKHLYTFAVALDRYHAGEFQGASEDFAALAGVDPVARRYAARCRELAVAPPPSWDGVWRLDSK